MEEEKRTGGISQKRKEKQERENRIKWEGELLKKEDRNVEKRKVNREESNRKTADENGREGKYKKKVEKMARELSGWKVYKNEWKTRKK